MGYRSDVKYVICLPDDSALTNYMAEVNLLLADKPDMKDVLDKITNSVQKEPTETGYTPRYKYRINVHWEWVKWYEGFELTRKPDDRFGHCHFNPPVIERFPDKRWAKGPNLFQTLRR